MPWLVWLSGDVAKLRENVGGGYAQIVCVCVSAY